MVVAEEFKSYFAGFGSVVEHQIMQDHSTGRSRGFGFVTFDSEQTVEDILAHGKMHELGGKQVSASGGLLALQAVCPLVQRNCCTARCLSL